MMLPTLFWRFFLVGLLTIGGGLAALPLLQELVVDGGWTTQTEFFDMLAVSQITPGPIGINMATYIGFQQASIAGALVATAGMVAPSLIIIVLIARSVRDFDSRPIVRHAMSGLRPAAVGLIATAAWTVLLQSLLRHEPAGMSLDWGATALLAGLGVAYYRFKGHPILYILAGAMGGLLL